MHKSSRLNLGYILFIFNIQKSKTQTFIGEVQGFIAFPLLYYGHQVKKGKSMEVLEQFTKGKISDALSEDRIFVSNDFAAVIDGVSDKYKTTWQGHHGGWVASSQIVDVLRDLNPNATCQDFIHQVNKAFFRFYENADLTCPPEQFILQAVAAVYSAAKNEIWLIGDAQVRMNGQNYHARKKSDEVLADCRSLLLHINDINDGSEAGYQAAREAIVPLILEATCFANKTGTRFSYAILNGEEIPEDLVQIIPLDDAEEFILASDGYPEVLDNLALTEEKLADVLEQDPGCYKVFPETKGLNPGQKSFDDRAYLRIRI